jgi:hypothetical protein
VIKSGRITWEEHVVFMRERANYCRAFVGKPERKKHFLKA